MAKFSIHMKMQSFELDIEGERADIPAISDALSRQITGLIQPAAGLTTGEDVPSHRVVEADTETVKPRTKPQRKRAGGSRSSGEAATTSIAFRHEPEKYGNPLQSWNVANKAIWLLYVLKGIAKAEETTAAQLVATFNDKFKQAKAIYPPHLSRALGNAKVQNPPPVGENKGAWYLTTEGDRQAQQLIQSVLHT